jgi:hypothetical protein
VIATGPGANSLHAIGTGIIGGMLASTVTRSFHAALLRAVGKVTGLFDRRAQSSAVGGAPGPAAPHAKREDD